MIVEQTKTGTVTTEEADVTGPLLAKTAERYAS
jgi:hypothetical protein